MILLIDNYDSFSYNLFQLAGTITPDIRVVRNDELTVDEVESLRPEGIILSPGPGRPADAGICIETVRKLGGKIPILGVCLGHQAICEAFGAVITYARELMHGKQSLVTLDRDCILFRDCPDRIPVGRYHSLAADPDTLPECLKVTARTDDGVHSDSGRAEDACVLDLFCHGKFRRISCEITGNFDIDMEGERR